MSSVEIDQKPCVQLWQRNFIDSLKRKGKKKKKSKQERKKRKKRKETTTAVFSVGLDLSYVILVKLYFHFIALKPSLSELRNKGNQ